MKRHTKGIILLAITIALFSTFEVSCKLVGTRLHPLQISFFRFLTGGLFLLPFALLRMKKKDFNANRLFWGDMLLLGFVNIVISMGLIQYGLLYINASMSAVIFSSNPLFVAIFAAALLGEMITPRKIAAGLAALAGVALLSSENLKAFSVDSLRGITLVLAAAIVFALYTVLGKRTTLRGTDSLIMTAFSFLTGSLLLLPIMLFMHIPLVTTDITLIPHILYLGIFVSGLAYMCYFYGLENMHTGSGTLVYFIKPVLASLIAVLLLGERLTANFYAGTCVIFAALLWGNYETIRGLFAKSNGENC